jgi:ferredoxin-NADP reductase
LVNNKLLLKLIEKKSITPRVYSLKFTLVEPNIFDFIPGQFISIFIPQTEGKVLRRSYSLVNRPGADFEIIYTYFQGGIASEYFKNLQIGHSVHAVGPLGRFVVNIPAAGKYIGVATGTGIGPFISMIKSGVFKGADLEMIFGCRGPNDSICENLARDFGVNLDDCNLTKCYSRHDKTQSDSFNGYVQNKLKTIDVNVSEDKFYLCGHPKMVEEASAYLLGMGVNKSNLIKEKYVVAGLNI